LDKYDEMGLLLLSDQEDASFKDVYASDVPVDIYLSITEQEPTAIGDDATGLNDRLASDGVAIDENAASLLDGDDQPMTFEGDDELGIDPIPAEVDDGGLEGLDDQGEAVVDATAFPPLDGDEQETEADIDIGYDIAPPPAAPDPDEPGDPPDRDGA